MKHYSRILGFFCIFKSVFLGILRLPWPRLDPFFRQSRDSFEFLRPDLPDNIPPFSRADLTLFSILHLDTFGKKVLLPLKMEKRYLNKSWERCDLWNIFLFLPLLFQVSTETGISADMLEEVETPKELLAMTNIENQAVKCRKCRNKLGERIISLTSSKSVAEKEKRNKY